MKTVNQLFSGFLKSKANIVKEVINSKGLIRTTNGIFRPLKPIKASQLEKGMFVFGYYNSYNQDAGIYEFKGVTGDETKYGENPQTIFNSVKECYKHFGIKSGKALEELQDQNEYGKRSYLLCKDLNDNSEGAWFYLYNGRWSIGSGGEALSFTLLEKIN